MCRKPNRQQSPIHRWPQRHQPAILRLAVLFEKHPGLCPIKDTPRISRVVGVVDDDPRLEDLPFRRSVASHRTEFRIRMSDKKNSDGHNQHDTRAGEEPQPKRYDLARFWNDGADVRVRHALVRPRTLS